MKITYFGFILISSIIFLQKQKYYWKQSSDSIVKSVNSVKEYYPQPDPIKNLYFIDMPDSLNGPPWNAYLFRSGLDRALEIKYSRPAGKLLYYRTKPLDGKIREDPFLEIDALNKMKEKGNIIFIYDWGSQQLLSF